MNIMALLNALPGSIAQGLIWGVFAIGVYITFKVLDFADMTVDGSIATGGSVAVMMMLSGHNVAVALVAATIVGMLAGMVTGIFHVALGIPGILAGILSQLGLYSVNMRILGKSNQAISVDKYNLILSLRDIHGAIIVSAIFCIVVIALMYGFFGTEMGRAFRATGNNEKMARAQGINTNTMKVLGLMVSNGLVAMLVWVPAQSLSVWHPLSLRALYSRDLIITMHCVCLALLAVQSCIISLSQWCCGLVWKPPT